MGILFKNLTIEEMTFILKIPFIKICNLNWHLTLMRFYVSKSEMAITKLLIKSMWLRGGNHFCAVNQQTVSKNKSFY